MAGPTPSVARGWTGGRRYACAAPRCRYRCPFVGVHTQAVSRSRLAMGSAGRGPPRAVRPRRARPRPHPAPQPPSDVFSCCFLRNCWKILQHTQFPQRETSKNTAESVLNRIAQVGPSCSCRWTCGPKIRISLITPPVKQQQCFGYRGQIIHFFFFSR